MKLYMLMYVHGILCKLRLKLLKNRENPSLMSLWTASAVFFNHHLQATL